MPNDPHDMLFDIAIVGYGPTGATLANLLAQCGLSVVVIERSTAIYDLPRAVHFDGEIMRVFQTIGIAPALCEKVRVNPGMQFVGPDGALLLDWPRPPEPGTQGWHASYRFHQPDLERLLREKLETHDNVRIFSGTNVDQINAGARHVTLGCTTRATGKAHKIRARYCVGCDGANSTVRSAIGTEMDDLGFAERWLVVDVLLRKPRPDLGDHTVQFCNPDRPMTYCRNPGNRRRWEIAIKPGENDEDITTPDRIWQLLSRWITPEDADLERHAVYTFRSMLARDWHNGRLLIAGDAAHLTPPFMGQGMCAGIRDSANLAWKLANVIKGHSKPSILASYQDERAPHARTFIETAMKLGQLINTMDSTTARQTASLGPNTTFKSIQPPLGSSDQTALAGQQNSLNGHLFAQPNLSDGQKLDDVVGYAPVLLSRKPIMSAHLPVLDGQTHPEIAQALQEIGAEAIILRPDRYIAASVKTGSDVAFLAQTNLPSPISARSSTQ
jgi:3-(3-hydroxy-phenyl)propionate hydroxylase